LMTAPVIGTAHVAAEANPPISGGTTRVDARSTKKNVSPLYCPNFVYDLDFVRDSACP
jgi:hypothetical protein